MTVTNQYYEFDPDFDPGAKVRSDSINLQFQAIQNAFDFMPDSNEAITTDTSIFAPESGSGNAYVVTMPDTRLSNQDGDGVRFFASHANTGAATIDVDGIGAVAFVNWDGTAFVGTEIISGNIYEIRFDAANARFVLAATLDAALNVTYAEAWAITPEDTLVPVAAGGDGATDFSALHWAAKSAATGGGGVQVQGTPVLNQIPIWVDADTIAGDPDVTFTGQTFIVAESAFGSSSVRIGTDGSVRYIGYYGAHATLGVDYSDDFVMTFSAGVSVFMIAGGRDVRIGNATFQDYGQFQHDGTFFNFNAVNTTGLKINDVPLYFEERAADGGAVGGFGQVWVRNDNPNVLMYTDDTGVDFVISTGGGGSPFATPLLVETVGNVAIGGSQTARVGITRLDASPLADWGFFGAQELEMKSYNHGARFVLKLENTSGVERQLLVIDPDTGFFITAMNTFSQTNYDGSTFRTAIATTHGGTNGVDLRCVGILSARVTQGSNGGMLVLNQVTGGPSLERVLTEGDQTEVGGFAQTITATWASSSGSTRTYASGANFQVAAGVNFEFDDNADLRFGTGNDVIFDYDAVDFNTAGPADGAIWDVIGFDQFRIAGTLGLTEQAAPDGDVAAIGQVWVRDDVPGTLMYTDDTGVDFELSVNSQFVEQVGDDTVNNTTTLIDTDLLLTNIPIGRYSLLMVVNARDVGVTGCGMRTDISTTGVGGTSVLRGAVKNFSGSGAPTTDLQGVLQDVMLFPSLSTGSGTDQIYYTGTLDVTSGTNSIQVEFAQENAQVGDLDFETGSFLALTKLD